MGESAVAQNKLMEAEQYCQQALSIQRTLNDYDHAGNTLEVMGRLAQRQGDYERAHALLQESLALRVKMGHRHALASVLEAFAVLHAAQGQAEWATKLFGTAETLLQQDGVPLKPMYQPVHDCLVIALREQLGESAFAYAWAAGAEMALDNVTESLMTSPFPK